MKASLFRSPTEAPKSLQTSSFYRNTKIHWEPLSHSAATFPNKYFESRKQGSETRRIERENAAGERVVSRENLSLSLFPGNFFGKRRESPTTEKYFLYPAVFFFSPRRSSHCVAPPGKATKISPTLHGNFPSRVEETDRLGFPGEFRSSVA